MTSKVGMIRNLCCILKARNAYDMMVQDGLLLHSSTHKWGYASPVAQWQVWSWRGLGKRNTLGHDQKTPTLARADMGHWPPLPFTIANPRHVQRVLRTGDLRSSVRCFSGFLLSPNGGARPWTIHENTTYIEVAVITSQKHRAL